MPATPFDAALAVNFSMVSHCLKKTVSVASTASLHLESLYWCY